MEKQKLFNYLLILSFHVSIGLDRTSDIYLEDAIKHIEMERNKTMIE